MKAFCDNLNHETLLCILGKHIADKRFVHPIDQFLRPGYVENWQYHETYSEKPEGGNLTPTLSNIYLNGLG